MVDEINKLLERIDYISVALYQNKLVDVIEDINELFPKINHLLLQFIGESDKYRGCGINVPQEILISQVKNFIDSFENKDVLMLADTLKYEIYEGLSYYREVLLNTDV